MCKHFYVQSQTKFRNWKNHNLGVEIEKTGFSKFDINVKKFFTTNQPVGKIACIRMTFKIKDQQFHSTKLNHCLVRKFSKALVCRFKKNSIFQNCQFLNLENVSYIFAYIVVNF